MFVLFSFSHGKNIFSPFLLFSDVVFSFLVLSVVTETEPSMTPHEKQLLDKYKVRMKFKNKSHLNPNSVLFKVKRNFLLTHFESEYIFSYI